MTDAELVEEVSADIRRALSRYVGATPPREGLARTIEAALDEFRKAPLRLAVDVTASPDDPTLFVVEMGVPACWLCQPVGREDDR